MDSDLSRSKRAELFSRIGGGEGAPVSPLTRYLLASAFVGAALAARFLLLPRGAGSIFLTFYPAIAFAALLFGAGPGLLALALSAACAAIFVMPSAGGTTDFAGRAVSLAIFSLSGGMICLLAFKMRRNADQSRAIRERFELLTTATFEGIALTEKGRVVECNNQLLHMLGYTRGELLGKLVDDLLPAKDRDRVMRGIQTGSESHVEHLIIRKDGQRIVVDAHGKTIINEGRTIRITALRDISEHRKLQATLLRAGERMHLAVDAANVGIWEADVASGDFIIDARQFAMVGYAPGDIPQDAKSFLSMLHPDDAPKFLAAFVAHIKGETPRLEIEFRITHKDGHWVWISAVGKVLERDTNGRALRLAGTSADITERKQLDEELSESEVRFHAVIEQSPMGVAYARDGVTIGVNAAYRQMFGYDSNSELIGQSVLNQIAPQCRGAMAIRVERRKQGEAVESGYETIGQRKDGSQFPVYVSAKRLEFKDGPLTFAFLIDITQQKTSVEEIRRLAFYDHLTALPNRRLLQDRLEQALLSSQRTGRCGALLFIDLDDFKSLNDTLGHTVGDALLQQIAIRLRSCLREHDSVARLGGDEFVVILEELSAEAIDAAQQTEAISKKIFAGINLPFSLASHEYHCTVSIGVTLFSDQKQANEELIKQADIAMYQAKKAGRNNLRFFDPKMQEAVITQAALEGELRQALEKGQFQLHFQAQVNRSGHVFGAEALIRWLHPERGLVSPAQFIPLAEDTELILPIGQWVLETACAQIKIWEQMALTHELALCINVSAKQFYRSDFVNSVRNAVRRHDINAERLTLELTESLMLENIEDTIAKMTALRDLGVRFSLDDFGTGYSSLQYLKRLPLHQLKIAEPFVRDIVVDQSDVIIVQTIIAMARSLKLAVIAEGVETQEQRQALESNGCDQFQGYLFGKPVSIEQFDAALKSKHPAFVGA